MGRDRYGAGSGGRRDMTATVPVGGAGGHAAGQELRRPFLVAAVLVAGLIVAVEIGAHFLVEPRVPSGSMVTALGSTPEGRNLDVASLSSAERQQIDALTDTSRPPGLAVPDLVFLDVLLFLTVGLMALTLVVREELVGRGQGVVMLIASILVIFGALRAAIFAFVKLLLMLALFLSPPFGTIAYFAAFGWFDRPGAVTSVGLVLFLKLAFCVAIVAAQQRFLQNKGLVIFLVISIVLTIVVGFLHSFVPLPLVSITDAVGALFVSIVAIIWAIVTLVFAVFAIVQAL